MCDTLLSPTPLHMHSSYLLYALKLEAQLREVRARPTTPLHYSSCGLSLTFSLSYSPIITRLTHSDTQLGTPHTPPYGAPLHDTQTGENFALRVSVDYHKLTVIATDGLDTEPFETDVVILHLGD